MLIDHRLKSLLGVLRNGKPRHTGEIYERLVRDAKLRVTHGEIDGLLRQQGSALGIIGVGFVRDGSGNKRNVWQWIGGGAEPVKRRDVA